MTNTKILMLTILCLFNFYPLTSYPQENSKNTKKITTNYNELDYKEGIIPFTNSENSIDLGMGKVPVMDTGPYYSTTFLSTLGALNAKLNLIKMIDVQCTQTLLNMLTNNDFYRWNDSPSFILQALKEYGIVIDKNSTCSHKIRIDQYLKISNTKYSDLISFEYSEKSDLNSIKAALKNGIRAIIETALSNDSGNPISVNGYNLKMNGKPKIYNGGLYACQQPESSISYCSNQNAAISLIVIGYDDNQQLLKLRNSWGSDAGENGNYYMTYSFFKAMAGEQVILK